MKSKDEETSELTIAVGFDEGLGDGAFVVLFDGWEEGILVGYNNWRLHQLVNQL